MESFYRETPRAKSANDLVRFCFLAGTWVKTGMLGMIGVTTIKMHAVPPMLKDTNGWKVGVAQDYADEGEKTGQVESLSGN